MSSHRVHLQRGFTLVELLIVISIVALLIALLLPALESSRAAARLVICKTNLRQIAIGMNTYSVDNRNQYIHPDVSTPSGVPVPKVRSWDTNNYDAQAEYFDLPGQMGNTQTYRNELFQCPEGLNTYPGNTDPVGAPKFSGILAYYSIYANTRAGVSGGIQFVDGDRVPQVPENMMRGPDDYLVIDEPGFAGNRDRSQFQIIASDLIIRSGNSGLRIMTNHMQGGDQQTQVHFSRTPLYVDTGSGLVSGNYTFTDGSVRAKSNVKISSLFDEMILAQGYGAGEDSYLLPEEFRVYPK